MGKTLKITPQINEERMVRLNLSIEEATTLFESKKGKIDQLRECQINLHRGGLDAIEPPSMEAELP